MVPVVLVAALVAMSLCLVHPTSGAGADQVSSLKAQALSVSQKIVLQQLEVDAYQQQVSVQSQRVASDNAQLAALAKQIGNDETQIAAKSRDIRHTAVTTYVNAGAASSNASVAIFTGNANRAQAASEYSNIAIGNITTTLDQLHTAQSALQSDRAGLARKQAQDQADLGRRSNDLSMANSTEQQLTATQAQVSGELAAAIAQQAAAQQAATAAAVTAAQRSAAAHAASANGSTSSTGTSATTGSSAAPSGSTVPTVPSGPPAGSSDGGGGVPTLTDPALNPFLQCVVQAESGGNYAAVSPNGEYMGAFQFSQATWNSAAAAAGLPFLVGIPPDQASKAAQDTVAVALYSLDGQQPWLGDRCAS